jgi:hypothetical protein
MADPDPLYFEVAKLVTRYIYDYAEKNKVRFTARATATLLKNGLSYRFMESQIDPNRVYEALSVIFQSLPVAREVDFPEIETAMRRSRCHYLWFC